MFITTKQLIASFFILYSMSAIAAKPIKQVKKVEPARSILVFNKTTSIIDVQENIHTPMPIASLTKLMTAYVVLESQADLNELIKITHQKIEGSNLLRIGMLISRRELLSLALIASDNLAAKMLAVAHPEGYDNFVELMNVTAHRLNMYNTFYIEPSGLLPNTSSAWDMHLLNQAASKYSIFTDAAMSKTRQTQALTQRKPGFLKQFLIRNTSRFAGMYDILVGKTGYTQPAGWCISMLVRYHGQEFSVIVLGSPNKQVRNDITEQHLKSYMNYITRYDMLMKIGELDTNENLLSDH